MRVLFLSQVLPFPLDAGPKVRSHYVLRYLAEAGHDVTVVSFTRPTDRQTDLEALGRFCRTVEAVPMERSRLRDVRDGLHSLVSSEPFLIARDRLQAMHERIGQLAGGGSFDAVHSDQLWMVPYATACPGVGLRVLDQHNAVFRVPQRLAGHARNPLVRLALHREAIKLARFERAAVGDFDRVVWVTEEDREAVGTVIGAPSAQAVIPIAVDPSARVPIERSRPFRVTFIGGMHWPPNAEGVRWFAEEVWPLVARAAPESVFTIIGRGNVGRMARADRSRVEVTGYLPDLSRHLSETAVLVVPLKTGAGMRVKILDAWCSAVPVVSTRLGAEGLAAHDGENIMLADEPEPFAQSVMRILRDVRLSERLSGNGRATVETCYDWRKVYQAWDRVYH